MLVHLKRHLETRKFHQVFVQNNKVFLFQAVKQDVEKTGIIHILKFGFQLWAAYLLLRGFPGDKWSVVPVLFP